MAANSKIEWTTHTANLWWGCTEVHSGCDNCYARVLSHRWGKNIWGNNVPRRPIKSVWKDLAKYQREAKKANRIDRVFVGSMMDIFEKSMPLSEKFQHFEFTDDLRQELFTQITWGDEGLYPNLLFLFLTKRPGNIPRYVPAGWLDDPPKNVMYGTSPVNQATFDMLVPQLMKIKGKKFLSVEPQLGPIDMIHRFNFFDDHPIEWIIQGGESGGHKRPFDLAWGRSVRDQCKKVGIPYFFKQIDKIQEIPEDLQVREFPV